MNDIRNVNYLMEVPLEDDELELTAKVKDALQREFPVHDVKEIDLMNATEEYVDFDIVYTDETVQSVAFERRLLRAGKTVKEILRATE